MPDNCNPSGCPVSARVEALEREFDRYRGSSSDTHRQMFDRIGALEQSGATLKTKLDSIEEKLDDITVTVKALAGRPARRWDGLVIVAFDWLDCWLCGVERPRYRII